ncbi:MAG TPA: M20 family metallopeptidase [Dongiaceae bacterium]|nr:M20 family metallopeptidase [Dongiaceae bacterium]
MAGSRHSAVELTQDLIRLRSINPPGEEAPCARLAGAFLSAAGFDVTAHSFAAERTSIVATLAGSTDREPICFTGHLDTVPLGAAAWARDPLAAEIDGDRLYGRGSSDMKSGVAAMLVAAMALAKLPRRKAGLVLIFTAGEETGCDGARYLTTLPNIVPKAGALLVGEPTGNYPLIGHKGALWLRAAFHGVTAHGSMPELGDNAVLKAARSVLRLADHRFGAAQHNHLGRPSLNIGSLHGGLNVNSVPDQADVQIDIRTVPGQSNEAIGADVTALLEEGATLTRMVDVGAVASNPQNEWISGVFDLYEQRFGGRVDPRGAPFFTDASVFTPAMGNVPTLILGPGETAMAHKTDEYCLVSKIDAAVDLYTEIGQRWICG